MSTLNQGVLDGVRKIGTRFHDLTIEGVPGAPLGYRLRGATTAGAPRSGTWKAGDTDCDRTGTWWFCVAPGTPGTWLNLGLLVPTAVQTSNYTANPQDFVACDASGGSFQVQLPAAPPNLTQITVKMINTSQSSGLTVSVLPGGSDVFNNSGNTAPRTLSLLNQGVSLLYSAANATWYVTDDDLPLTQVKQLFPDWVNVASKGAAVNGKMVADAAISASGSTLTSASAAFTPADVGKIGVIMGAGVLNGSIGVPLPFSITGFSNSTTVTVSATATTTVTNATCYYGTDDRTAVQAAITAAANGQCVFFPAGIIMLGSELSVTKPLRLTGDAATIVTTSSAAVNFGNTYISAASGGSATIGLEIDHLVFDCSGGHIFYGINWNKFTLHDLRLVQRSYNFAVFYSNNATCNQLDGYCHNIVTRVYGNPRSVQSWYVLSNIGGGMAMCKWQNCLWQQNDSDTTQYFCWFECNGTHNYTNDLTFDNCWFDSAYGGCVKLLSVQGAAFRSCNIIDSFSTAWGGHGYYIGASAGGSAWASQFVSFRDMSRDLQGPNGSATWDIYLESTTDSVMIDTYVVRDIPGTSVFHQYFNENGCTNVTTLNCNGAVISNAATSGVTLGPSGNIGYSGLLTGATQPNVALPSDQGYTSWTFDPSALQGNATPVLGALYVAAFYLRVAALISTLSFWLDVAGSGLAAGENLAGLFTTAGVLLTGSADQTAHWGATGIKDASLTTPQSLTAGWYWAAILTNGTTAPKFGRGASGLTGGSASQWPANAGTSGGSARYASSANTYGTALANFTPGGAFFTGTPVTLWVGVK